MNTFYVDESGSMTKKIQIIIKISISLYASFFQKIKTD